MGDPIFLHNVFICLGKFIWGLENYLLTRVQIGLGCSLLDCNKGDLPMDYADASIVCLATDTGMKNVVTFDIKDFAIYKLPKKKGFTIMP